jgi:hypothetical protein
MHKLLLHSSHRLLSLAYEKGGQELQGELLVRTSFGPLASHAPLIRHFYLSQETLFNGYFEREQGKLPEYALDLRL